LVASPGEHLLTAQPGRVIQCRSVTPRLH
jgi:hypothetical protein